MNWLKILGLGFLVVSCASVHEEEVAEFRTVENRPVVKKSSPPKSGKQTAGRVTFAGLSQSDLASFRVIPEEGKRLFQPENKSYFQVDGFWWKGEQDRWFKIPDLSEAWVGEGPPVYQGESHRGPLRIYHSSPAFLGMMDRLSSRALRPAWVPDRGETRSPVPRPREF